MRMRIRSQAPAYALSYTLNGRRHHGSYFRNTVRRAIRIIRMERFGESMLRMNIDIWEHHPEDMSKVRSGSMTHKEFVQSVGEEYGLA